MSRWWGLSILNENQHQINGNTIKCFDATVAEIKRINPDIVSIYQCETTTSC